MTAAQRRLITLVRVLLLTESSMYAVLSPLLPHYAHALHASKAQIGILGAAYSAGLIPGAPLGGWLATRLGVRRTTVVGLLGFAATSVALGLVAPLSALDALRATQGLFCGLIWGGALTWVIAATPREQRGATIGKSLGAATLGTLAGPLIGTLAAAAGTTVVFVAFALVVLGLAVWTHRTPDPGPAGLAQAAQAGEAPGARAMLAAVRRAAPQLALGAWVIALSAMVFGALGVLLPLRLSHLGAGEVAIGATFVVASAVSASLSGAVGRQVDRHGPRLTIAAGLVLGAPLVAALVLPTGAAALAIVAVIAMGVPFTASIAPATSLMTHATERAGVALVVATSLVNLAFATGEVIGAPVAAAVSEATGDALPLLALAALVALTLAPVLRGVARRRGEPAAARGLSPRSAPR